MPFARLTKAGVPALLCTVSLLAQTPSPGPAPCFDVRVPKGIDFILRKSRTSRKYLIETMPGGVALLDYNNDGLLDIFLVNAGRVRDPLPRLPNFDRHEPSYWNRLYRQNKDGSFTDATQQAGLANVDDGNYGMGVAVGDYDNDGYPDIYVTNFGKNILYHNNGDGTFTDVTTKAGVAAGGWSVSAGFFDYDNDGHLDLFVTRYLDWSVANSKTCGTQENAMYCPPTEFPAISNILYHNRGDGTFEDVSQKSGIGAIKGHSLGVAFADYDDDGFTDVFVASDVTNQFLFRNNGDGTFREVALDAGAALTADGKMLSGMGVVFQDYDNDDRPDIVVTQLPHQPYVAFHNDGRGAFSEQGLEAGLGALSGSVSGWGVGLEDFNNDGWKDLFVVQGHVFDNVEKYDSTSQYLEPPLLALNHGGRFERADAGSSEPMAGRGAAFGDLNNDGWVDVVTTRLGGSPLVFQNRGGKAHWIGIALEGTRSNRDGYGAKLVVNGQVRFATAAGSYLSSNDPRVHFGLGESVIATIEIRWPSGALQKLTTDRVDRYLTVREPSTH
ncbi:MAG TPA: CRTAC1 family protein [Candidatus Acidoferrum sp.]|nr:CRTAC1 family protein [Candidatus Acidoferrum sp.]